MAACDSGTYKQRIRVQKSAEQGKNTMGHLTSRDAYRNLEDRINWFTQGAPPSETLTKILKLLFTEKEAKWVAMLPIRPFSLKKAAQIWGTTEGKAEKLLDHLCEKGLLVDSYHDGVRQFVLPPPMIGFFEFALMRTRGDIDQKYLSELFYQSRKISSKTCFSGWRQSWDGSLSRSPCS